MFDDRLRKTCFIVLVLGSVLGLPACDGQTAIEPEITITEMAEVVSPTFSYTDTPVPTPTETSIPTLTPTTTITPTPTPKTIDSNNPSPPGWSANPWPGPGGPPVEIWDEIPIMPNAFSGSEAYDGYYYSAPETVNEVGQYYQQELGKLGYSLDAIGENESSIRLIFKNNGDKIEISAIRVDIESMKMPNFTYKGIKIESEPSPEFHGSYILVIHKNSD